MVALSQEKFKKLHDSITWSNRQIERQRTERIDAIKQYVGYHYSSAGAQKKVPVGMLKLAIDIYRRSLVARAPRALITTRRQELRSVAANLELAVNQVPEEINLEKTMQRVVLEALFSMGVARCGLHTVGQVLGQKYGKAFVECVSLDDLVIDMTAKHLDQITYIGHDYWADYDDVMDSDWFPKDTKANLKADEYTVIGAAGETRAESIAVSESAQLYRDKVWLRDVWLPNEGLVVTYGVKSETILKAVEWDGPDGGPYHILGFSDVPGNLLPLAPVSVWRDLHELGNALFRKLGRQADSQKTVLGFTGGNEESAENFKKSTDGEGCLYNGPPPQALTAGGVDPRTLAFYLQVRDLYSYFAGNLDSLGGLAPMTETLGQDRLLGEAASAQLRDMTSAVVSFSRSIFKSLAFYEWHDPIVRRQLEKPIPGTDLSIPVTWDRKSKQGKFKDYELDIDVYSLQDNSPGIRLQKLGLVIQQYVLPLMPAIQQAGGTLDVEALLRMVSHYADLPEMGEIVTFVDNPNIAQGAESAAMPQQTTRRYERVNRPGGTDRGKSKVLQEVLLGGRPQEDEMATVGRRTS